MKKYYISVIIPAYNAHTTLVKLLASLRASSFKHFEVIIGDDASNEQLTVMTLQGDTKKKSFPLRVVRLTRNRSYGWKFYTSA